MKVGIFLQSANHPRFDKALRYFASGVELQGDEPILFENDLVYQPCDVAVIFGSWKPRPNNHHIIKNSVVQNAEKFIVLETPLLGRGPVKDIMEDDSYRIGVNGFLHDTGRFNNHMRPIDRWDIIRKKFNLEIKSWNENYDAPIVIVLQIPGDASLRGCNIAEWACISAEIIRNQTDRQILVRMPQISREYDMGWIEKLMTMPGIEMQQGTKANLIPTLEQAYCTVTYTSGMAIESVLNGCPTIACDPGNFAFPISRESVFDINNLRRESRQQWVQDLSYCQWDESEIGIGLPWKHLKNIL